MMAFYDRKERCRIKYYSIRKELTGFSKFLTFSFKHDLCFRDLLDKHMKIFFLLVVLTEETEASLCKFLISYDTKSLVKINHVLKKVH